MSQAGTSTAARAASIIKSSPAQASLRRFFEDVCAPTETSAIRNPPRLERDARGELERPGAARAEDPAGGRHGLSERGGAEEPGARRVVAVAHEHVREAGVVRLRHAEYVRHVEEVEDLHY